MPTTPLLAALLGLAAGAGVVGLAGVLSRHPGEGGAFALVAVFVAAVLAIAALCAAP